VPDSSRSDVIAEAYAGKILDPFSDNEAERVGAHAQRKLERALREIEHLRAEAEARDVA
jgi:hypothetical protein